MNGGQADAPRAGNHNGQENDSHGTTRAKGKVGVKSERASTQSAGGKVLVFKNIDKMMIPLIVISQRLSI